MKTRLSVLLNIVLIAALAYGAYKFIIQGSVEQTDDGRTAVILTAAEKDFVLSEMRGFLETVQGIVSAIAEEDMASVAEIATAAGSADAGNAPAPLVGKLPLEFKDLGMATHALFDDIATRANESADAKTVTQALGELMQNCTGCHAGYRLDIEPAN